MFYFIACENTRVDFNERAILITKFNKKVTHNSLIKRIKITISKNSKSFNQNFKGV